MEYTLTISKFNHDDIVNILASSAYDSEFIGIRFDKQLWLDIPEDSRSRNPCLEDYCADLLLNGKHFYLCDAYYDEYEENQSNIRSGEVIIEEDEWGNKVKMMRYAITLQDFINAANTQDGSNLMREFIEGEDDLYTSENFLQLVMFGDIIYG